MKRPPWPHRQSRGSPHTEIGELIEVRRQTYGKCESGPRQIRALDLLAIRNAFREYPFKSAANLRQAGLSPSAVIGPVKCCVLLPMPCVERQPI